MVMIQQFTVKRVRLTAQTKPETVNSGNLCPFGKCQLTTECWAPFYARIKYIKINIITISTYNCFKG